MEYGRGVRGENSRSWLTGMALSLMAFGPVGASFGLAAEPTRARASEKSGSSTADVWGSEAPITGVALDFTPEGDDYRIGGVEFGFHGPTPAGVGEFPAPLEKVGSKFFGGSSEVR